MERTTLNEAIEAITTEPHVRHIVSVSGGKDSAALAVYLKLHYPQIPAEYVFCDTGVELPETYEYLEKMEAILGVEVKKVNALDSHGITEKYNRNAFDWLLYERYGGFLPSPQMRWCTSALKIKPFEHYVGDSQVFSYIGIRADENRLGYQGKKPPVLSQRPNITPIYPFKDDDLRLEDIKEILEESGLGLPRYYQWRSRSGCFFCFYQQKGEWQRLKENHPALFERAKTYEKFEEGKRYTWVERQSLEELEKDPVRHALPVIDEEAGCAICHL